MTYDDWLYQVNRILLKTTGLAQEDFPDWPARDA